MPTGSIRSQGGYSYLVLLFLVAGAGLLLAGTGEVWHTQAVREKEIELLFVGGQYRRAFASFHRVAGAGVPVGGEWPRALDDLVLDHRCLPVACRHLRRLYRDPLTGTEEWGLVRIGDRIAGVYSLMEGEPLKRSGFSDADAGFEKADHYRFWRFVDPSAPVPPPRRAGLPMTTFHSSPTTWATATGRQAK